MDDAEKAHWQEVFGSIDEDHDPSDELIDRTTNTADPGLKPKPADRPNSKVVERSAGKPPKADRKAAENAHWQKVFGSIDDDPELRNALNDRSTLLTDAEIAEIQREIDRES